MNSSKAAMQPCGREDHIRHLSPNNKMISQLITTGNLSWRRIQSIYSIASEQSKILMIK